MLCLSIAAILTACATFRGQYESAYCNYDGAFDMGLADGHNNKQKDDDLIAACPAEKRASTERGYQEGYLAGLHNQSAKAW